MLDAAHQLAGRGWKIFPLHNVVDGRCSCGRACESPGKHPRPRGGFKAASADAKQIEAWWTRWPDANIGLATGNGLVVVDVDGLEGMAELQAGLAGQTLPRTLTAQTGRGLHLYLAGELRSSARGKVHVRGDGGYVVAPPSIHANGTAYRWLIEAPIAPLPDWFKHWLETSGDTRVTASGGSRVAAGLRIEVPAHLIERRQRLAGNSSSLVARALQSFIEPWSEAEEARIVSALQALPADCSRDDWLKVGMALHSLDWESGGTGGESGDRGYDLWLEWSRQGGSKFQGEFDCETRWRSFGKRGGVGLGTLFHLAEKAGWTGWQPAVTPGNQGLGGPGPAAAAPLLNGHHVPLPIAFNLRFDRDKAGNIKATCDNTIEAIKGLELDCKYDTFHERLLVGGQVLQQWAGELSDVTTQKLRNLIRAEFGFDPGVVHCHDAAVRTAIEHPFDPVLDYLDGLEWDGRPRLETWLSCYMGAADTALNRAIGKLGLVAAVRRACVPGTKFDQIIVMESAEGHGKSTAIEILAGADNFSDQPILALDDRGQQEAVQGVWLYEIADLAGMARAEVERVKAFASRRVDRARPAYGRSRTDKPRRCVFFASTNDDTYLKSQTGNRRFWPVRVGKIELDLLKRERDQLWAEAVEMEHGARRIVLEETLWNDVRAVQEDRRESDPWEHILAPVKGKLFGDEWRLTARDMLDLHLRLPAGQQTGGNLKRASQVMQRLGWERAKFKVDGDVIAGYRKRPGYL